MDDTDEEDLDCDNEADGMVLDEREIDFARHGDTNDDNLSDDQATLNLRDSDEETDVDSVMMVRLYLYHLSFCFLLVRIIASFKQSLSQKRKWIYL